MKEDASVSVATVEAFWALCPRCNGVRRCNVHGEHEYRWVHETDHHSMSGSITFKILECRGCELPFFWQSSWNSENTDHQLNEETGEWDETAIHSVETFPPADTPKKAAVRPDWTWNLHKRDSNLSRIMLEVYSAAEADLLLLASVGLRAALDRTSELVGIDAAEPMDKKIGELQKGGWVGETEAETLRVVANAGNAAAHQGWAPQAEEFKHLRETIEQFIYRALIMGKRALEIAPQIPARQKRKKDRNAELPAPLR